MRWHFTHRLLLGAACILSGCGGLWHTTSTGHCSFLPDQPSSGRSQVPGIEVIVLGGFERNEAALRVAGRCLEKTRNQGWTRNRSLIAADCGILATYANGPELAKEGLDESIASIQSITVGGKYQEEAISLHGAESAKIFKGEPHERVLVYLHRGLLFLSEGDYENAHACFLNASLQDALAKEKRNRGDWMTIDALLLLCKRAMNSNTADDFASQCDSRYAREASKWRALAESCASRKPVVMLIAVGRGPQKRTARAGNRASALGYREVGTLVAEVRLSTSTNYLSLVCSDDVYLQAETRGQRNMDELLARKAKASEDVDTAGTVVATIAQIGSSAVPGLGLLGAVIQEAAMQESHKIDASADVRQLYSAPRTIHLLIADQADLAGPMQIKALDETGSLVARQDIIYSKGQGRPVIIVGRIPY